MSLQRRFVSRECSPLSTLRHASIGVAFFALSACGGGGSTTGGGVVPPGGPSTTLPSPSPSGAPASGTLSLVNGISSVSKTSGATLDAFANADPPNMVFDKWVGDTSVLLSPGERRSGVALSGGARTVTATYKPLAEFTPQSTVLNGLAATDPLAVHAYWFFPQAHPRGVIFRFHGTTGNGGSQFTKVEERKLSRDAVGDGFAYVSLDSNDRVNKSWDPTTVPSNPAANVDVVNITKLIGILTGQGLMDSTTPIFASGMSDGAGAALRFAFLLNWKASHQACVPGTTQIAQTTTVPGIWTMAQFDVVEDPNRNASAQANSNALAARGVPTAYVVVAPSAVYPSRFTQIVGLRASDSQAIYASLKNAGLLDANDFQINDPNTISLSAVVPAQYQAFSQDIQGELNAAYTVHQFSAATDRQVLTFFEARLP